jgi:hypothetical protein
MRTSLTISCAGHAAVLVLSVVTFVGRPHPAEPTEALPIDIVSASELAKMTSGAKNAPPAEKPTPVAEKIGDPTPPPEDANAKIANKEIKAATDTPPAPEVKPPEPKAKKPPQPAPPPVDQIADVLKKDDKPESKKPDPKPPTPPKKPAQEAPAFDPRQVEALLNKQAPQRVASAGNQVSSVPTVGTSKNSDDKVTQNELAAMQAKILQLWIVPIGAKEEELSFDIQIQLNRDGTLAVPPKVNTAGDSPLLARAKESAIRALTQGAPYTMLRPEHYETWKDPIIAFHPVFTN